MSLRILLVEDEPTIARPLARTLEGEGYLVCVADRGQSALELNASWSPDVVLLDLKLPDIDGIEVTRRLRTDSPVPVIMVTARSAPADRIRGLEGGADDYIVKPFEIQELIARVRAVVRRREVPKEAAPDPLCFRDLELYQAARRVLRDGEAVPLSFKEFEILRILMLHRGATVRRDDLSRSVWNASVSEVGKSLDVHVSWLRSKLGDNIHCRYIETVRGVGFRLAYEAE